MPLILRVIIRVFLVLLAVAIGGVLAEGAFSLVTGQSLLSRLLGVAPSYRLEMLDEERLATAALTPGSYALATDPHVGFRLKGGVVRNYAGVPGTTDSEGQRVRVGPEPEPGAARIVVLGDSVAFGFGVRDDETLAQRTEAWLAETMRPGAPRPVVRTIACPGWNLHNSMRYLSDRLEELDPSIVILLPVGNDLYDSFAVNEVGHRHADFDPRWGATRVHTSLEFALLREQVYGSRRPRSETLALASSGGPWLVPHVTVSGVTLESLRRWRELLSQLRTFRQRLAERGSRLAVAIDSQDPVIELMQATLARDLPELPRIPLFVKRQKGDALPNDPHPSQDYLRACGWCVADFLITQGWVDGAGARPLPPLDPQYATRRWKLVGSDIAGAALEVARKRRSEFIGPRIDLDSGRGIHQIYGGLDLDGLVGRGLWIALHNQQFETLELTIDRLPSSSAIYPLELEVSFNDAPATRVAILPPADEESRSATLVIPVPVSLRESPFLDVLIRPLNWIVTQIHGVSSVVALRFVRAELR